MVGETITFAQAQYDAVRSHHLEENWPDADRIGIMRGSFNLIWETVESEDLHVSVT